MKLMYCFLTCSLLSIHFSQAQIDLKIKAGAARSNLGLADDGWTAHAIITWYAGVATTLRMGEGFFFQPELLYSERGANLGRSYVGGVDVTLARRYGYISIPLLMGWHPAKKMSILFGAEPGYMIWDHATNRGYDHTYEDVDHRFNVDLDLGFAYQPLPRWTIEVRGLTGVIGLYETWQYATMGEYKTGGNTGSHFLVQLGLRYDLKAAAH
jgi:Outer membrane protein beta-barrel domain